MKKKQLQKESDTEGKGKEEMSNEYLHNTENAYSVVIDISH